MEQYISKSAVVAEIERRYEYWREKESNSHSIESEIRMSECQHLMLLFNTLEVKEVDFEAEWKKYFEYRGEVATVNVKHLAKHFFELGMAVNDKPQKRRIV